MSYSAYQRAGNAAARRALENREIVAWHGVWGPNGLNLATCDSEYCPLQALLFIPDVCAVQAVANGVNPYLLTEGPKVRRPGGRIVYLMVRPHPESFARLAADEAGRLR